MASKLSVDAFLRVIAQSGLLTSEKLNEAKTSLKKAGVDVSLTDAVADALVDRKTLTRWQVDKLLQGKHKGFFLGKYRLLSLLGKGGMSSVYLAEHVLMRRHCAIKVLPAKRVHDTSYLGRFHREAQAVAALDHPNIVRAYDVDQEINKNADRSAKSMPISNANPSAPTARSLKRTRRCCAFAVRSGESWPANGRPSS